MSGRVWLRIITGAALLSACSVQQVQILSPLAMATDSNEIFELVDSVAISAERTASTVLRAGTSWSRIGTIEQGEVFGTKDQVVIVNSVNVYEAYIVVRDSNVVGYYLIVERTYVETNPVEINLAEQGIRDEE